MKYKFQCISCGIYYFCDFKDFDEYMEVNSHITKTVSCLFCQKKGYVLLEHEEVRLNV